jgi:transposase
MGRPAADFPHPKLVYHYFKTWTRDGTLDRMHNLITGLGDPHRLRVPGAPAQ